MLSIRLFGKFSVSRDGRALAGLDAPRVQELFAYLLLHRDRPQLRENLATALWNDCGNEQARKYLRQTLWQLQSAVDETDSHVVVADPDAVGVNSHMAFELDVATFECSIARARGVGGRDLQAEAATALEQATQLYAADLLDGWYQDWCLFERERLQNLFMQTLDKLMVYCQTRRDYETGLYFGSRLLSFDPAHERTHRRLMRLHYLAGDRTAALRQYQRCTALLAEELDVKPGHRTTELFEQIRSDSLIEPLPSAAPAYPDTLNGVVERIADLQASLSELMLTLVQTTQRRDDRPPVDKPLSKGVTEVDVGRMSSPA
jgi:DNA-binding SARP family transcriptional activator